MWATAAPARAASSADSAICAGVTGTSSLRAVVAPAPVTAHVMKASVFTGRAILLPLERSPDGGSRLAAGARGGLRVEAPEVVAGEVDAAERSRERRLEQLPAREGVGEGARPALDECFRHETVRARERGVEVGEVRVDDLVVRAL